MDSRIRHLNGIGKVLSAVGAMDLIIGMINVFNPVMHMDWVNLLCATFVMYVLGRVHGKKEALEKERMLRE